jgi:hypothetical protein
VKTRLSRVIVALLIASSLLIAGTAHAGYGSPGGGTRVVLSSGQ